MTNAMTTIGLVLGLVLAMPLSANDRADSPPVAHESTQIPATLADMDSPSDFSDDICWVAPEWRDD